MKDTCVFSVTHFAQRAREAPQTFSARLDRTGGAQFAVGGGDKGRMCGFNEVSGRTRSIDHCFGVVPAVERRLVVHSQRHKTSANGLKLARPEPAIAGQFQIPQRMPVQIPVGFGGVSVHCHWIGSGNQGPF